MFVHDTYPTLYVLWGLFVYMTNSGDYGGTMDLIGLDVRLYEN